MAVARKDLVCKVSGLTYDFETRKGTLKMAPVQCCDMAGCIDLFTKIDPNVQLIETFAGDKSDTIFKRMPSGWESVLTR